MVETRRRMSEQEKKPAGESTIATEVNSYTNCIAAEKKSRLDTFIANLKAGRTTPEEFGMSNAEQRQAGAYESRAFEEALDACANEPGAKYFERRR